MNKLKQLGLFLLATLYIASCSSVPDNPWSDAIPQKAPFVIIPQQDASLGSVLQSSYTPFLDDITSSAIQLLSRVDSTAANPIPLDAIMLYPGAEDQLETVWLAKAPKGFIKLMRKKFYKDFTQNQYYFHGIEIEKLNLQERNLFAAQLRNLLLISESSLGIEDAIRAYTDRLPRAHISGLNLKPGHIIMNTPSLDGWVQQLTKVGNRPLIIDALKGTEPALLSVTQKGEQQNREFQFSGTIALNDSTPSTLVSAFSSSNAPISLDRYISSNAAAFGLFRTPPRLAAPTSVPDTTQLDSVLMKDATLYSDLSKSLSPEFSLVMYAESGFLSTGEHLFLRKASSISKIRRELASLADQGLIQQRDDSYLIKSSILAELIGSSLCGYQDFYLNLTGDAIAISKRKGLVEIVASDRSRRRTVYYDQAFRDLKQNLPEQISSMFVSNNDFYSFIEPFLAPDSYLNAITSKFDVLAASTTLSQDKKSLTFNINTYQTKDRSAPYQEKWLFPTGSDLSGEPVLANIGGSAQDEVIFATGSGNVYALAADGTVVMQGNTSSDTPIGSPVIYDWYGTNQKVILQAAGNKIYGWDDNGQLLPKFPFELGEQITTPLVVEDVDRNGLPDAIVATANRQLHVLNGRGQNLNGWPVTTNAEINTKPVIDNSQGVYTILAFAENALHSWFADGSQKNGFPKFINASFTGSPVSYDDHILGNAADGYLYAIGPDKMFADSLNVFESSNESSDIEAIYASNSSLVGSPSVDNLQVQNEDKTYNEPMILTMSSNGSIFLINTKGQLRFTQNMGQPAASSFSPFISDINRDNQSDIIALANFGRLYVWQVANGKRIYSVPTAGMQFPIVTDIDEDGYNELLAQTQEGLRCWTIYGENRTAGTP